MKQGEGGMLLLEGSSLANGQKKDVQSGNGRGFCRISSAAWPTRLLFGVNGDFAVNLAVGQDDQMNT